MTHFISLAACTPEELRHLLDVSRRLKKQLKETGQNDHLLADKTLAMIFEKPSLRTRVSFSVAMTQLGGNGLLLSKDEVGLGTREPVKDVARVLSGMCDGIMARTFSHASVIGLAEFSTLPVINALTDYSHPCQAMADMLTIEESLGSLAGKTIAYIGDGNNVARSLAVACAKFGMNFVIAAPRGYELPADDLKAIATRVPNFKVTETSVPASAVKNADVVYTDVWTSMGQEAEKTQRVSDFEGFCVNETLMEQAPTHAIVLHCLPAYRDLEISNGVMEGPNSRVFQQAENRLHVQKGLLAVLMGRQ